MKIVQLLHNPGSGEEKYTREYLVSLLQANGFDCVYTSTEGTNWKQIKSDADFIVVAGGDGTIRKVARAVLKKKDISQKIALAILPLGTANNIARTLGLNDDIGQIVKSWHTSTKRALDIGCVHHKFKSNFFIEGFGYGIFPMLVKKMVPMEKKNIVTSSNNLDVALNLLYQIATTYEARYCHLEADGKDYSGRYLLAEVMNIRSIGPNLRLSPFADPGDGLLDLVLVPESDRSKLASYVSKKMNDAEQIYVFPTVRAKKINMKWDGEDVHVDDKIKVSEKWFEVQIEVEEGQLEFLI